MPVDGNLGIGVTVPSFKLQVIDSSNTGLRVQTNTAGGTVASFGGNGVFQIDAPGVVGGDRSEVVEARGCRGGVEVAGERRARRARAGV